MHWDFSVFVLTVSIGLIYISPKQVLGYFGLTAKQSLFSLIVGVDGDAMPHYDVTTYPDAKMCALMSMDRHQRRFCVRQTGSGAVLIESTKMAADECARLFANDRWNCSLSQPHRYNTLRKAFKETGFLHALTSSSIVHSVARACSSGQIDHCTCGKSLNDVTSGDQWRWGGCGDNLDYASVFVRKFLRTKTWDKDLKGRVDLHNSKAGIKIVKKGVEKICKCHGVSGSCTVKTCWKQLAPFSTTGSVLKSKYDSAKSVVMASNQVAKESHLFVRGPESSDKVLSPKRRDILFVEKSPNFCVNSGYSSGTRGRKCGPKTNCDVLCCGRGYDTSYVHVDKPCHCKVVWCCEVKCQICSEKLEIYTCK